MDFACSEEGVHHRDTLGGIMRACEHIVFSAQCQGADLVLDPVVVQQQAPIHKQGHQGVPLIFDIGERPAYRTLGGVKLSVYPSLELLVKRFQV